MAYRPEAMGRVASGGGVDKEKVDNTIDHLNELYQKKPDELAKEGDWVVRQFYNMVSDIYEWGWGSSFHFAPRYKGEAFAASIARHEHLVALKLGLKPGMKVLDLGCGVGGPAREIARFSGASITGCNINDYQLKRFMEEARKKGLADLLDTKVASYEDLPFPDNSVDAIYELEAFCHATDLKKAYSEAYRVLKPGQSFCSFEWVLTDKFDYKNQEHLAIKKGIEEGNGLVDMHPIQKCVDAAKAAGFEIVESRDVSDGADLSWFNSLAREFSVTEFSYCRVGRELSSYLCGALEAVKIAPKGTRKINEMLCKTANHLVKSGKLGIFSPTYMLLVRKPLSQ